VVSTTPFFIAFIWEKCHNTGMRAIRRGIIFFMENISFAGIASMAGGFVFFLVAASIWTAVWKGLALWRAARLKSVGWFVALLFINTMGILEIIYILAVAKKMKGPELRDGKLRFSEEEAKAIGEFLGIKWDKYNVAQFHRGMNVELEHGSENSLTDVTGDDAVLTGKIALAHLNEFADYYDRLDRMEEDAHAFWDKK